MKNTLELHADDVSGQPIFRNSQVQHAAHDRCGFKDRHFISIEGEIVRARYTGRPGPHDGYLDVVRLFLAFRQKRLPRFGAKSLASGSLESSDRDGAVEETPPTGGLTGMGADAAAD
jgi:hypothetical protein